MYESGEMYLETIFTLRTRLANVRAIDISEEMNFSKPSVSRALSKLRNDGFIFVDNSSGFITLTESGEAVASKIFERHQVISALLVSLGVSEETAVKDACKIEHDISEESFDKIKQFYGKNFKHQKG